MAGRLRVVVPFTPDALDERAVAALRAQAVLGPAFPHGGSLELIDVSETPTSYYDALARLWRECAASLDDLLVVEHDVVVAPGTIEALAGCPEPWCACPPSPPFLRPIRWLETADTRNGWTVAALTCNRWRAEFIAEHADLFATIAPIDRHWRSLDAYSLGRLPGQVHLHHEHQTEHRHTGPQPGSPDDTSIADLAEYRDRFYAASVGLTPAEFADAIRARQAEATA
jgi:hypothetical protein